MAELFAKTHSLTKEEARALAEQTMLQPWIQKLLVFGDYAIFILESKTMEYLYVSSSVENMLGYESGYFKDFSSLMPILKKEDLNIVTQIAQKVIAAYSQAGLSQGDLSRLRISYNIWGTRKDGSSINCLQQAYAIKFDENQLPQLQLLILSDITRFNDSPHHFYRATLDNLDGTESVIIQGVHEQDIAPITAREQEVFGCLVKGLTSEEIATRLNLSVETVKVHRKNLQEKTGTGDAIHLLRYGYSHGWI